MMKIPVRLVTLDELAEFFRYSRSRMEVLVKELKLPHYRIQAGSKGKALFNLVELMDKFRVEETPNGQG